LAKAHGESLLFKGRSLSKWERSVDLTKAAALAAELEDDELTGRHRRADDPSGRQCAALRVNRSSSIRRRSERLRASGQS
jgi:hypothetical protein